MERIQQTVWAAKIGLALAGSIALNLVLDGLLELRTSPELHLLHIAMGVLFYFYINHLANKFLWHVRDFGKREYERGQHDKRAWINKQS